MSDTLACQQLAPEVCGALRERFEREMAAGTPLACMLIAIDRLERCADVEVRARLWGALTTHLRAHEELGDTQFERNADNLWLLVPRRSAKDCTALARALVEGVRKLRVENGASSTRLSISIGLAVARPTLCFEAFVQVADEGLGVARNGGGDRAVHTEVYDFIQKKVTGKLLPTAKELTPAPPARGIREVEVPAVAPHATTAASVLAERNHTHFHAIEHVLAPVERATAAATKAEEPERVEMLERRIAKLLHALESAEQRILRLESSDPQHGIASLYREVQGLDPDARFVDAKRQMMTSIFEANLALRGRAAS